MVSEQEGEEYARKKQLPETSKGCMKRWPRLTANLICASLGYFSPTAAANAILAYRLETPFACEWYSHICSCRGKGFFTEDELIEINREVISSAFRNRANHTGYMADYRIARALVDRANETGEEPILGSWF